MLQKYKRRVEHNLSTLTTVTVQSWSHSWNSPSMPGDSVDLSDWGSVTPPKTYTTIDMPAKDADEFKVFRVM